MSWASQWVLDHDNKRISLSASYDQSNVIQRTLDDARQRDIFKVLKGWRGELYPIRGCQDGVQINIERAASPLFGVNTYGVHMMVYVCGHDGMKLWVPRRTRSKQTYGGMLDNTVAGGLSTGEKPFDCLIREAAEEASFPEVLVRSNAKPCGTVSYIYVRDERAGGEIGLLQPECQYVYDMEVGPSVIPKPGDNEVEEFYLWGIEEVKKALAEGQFKPNCAVVLLDFFVRHGILTAENEKNYVEIVSRIHRKLPFPTS